MIQFDNLLDYIDLVFDRIIVYKPIICHDITYLKKKCLHIMCLNRSKNTIKFFLCSIKFAQMFAVKQKVTWHHLPDHLVEVKGTNLVN